ncbi:hypothetical protein [Actinopolyspora mortivallis]|uniref:Uncharacterized protein n=1 Tax=Actinopolyspora mortivallis TaxID=33906 RepID=A0A2T0GUN9_ACTMO|nr:hypothetical protein [Actinopolyspora mortivallis]PRW62838.1 hypothetical protein CEP50_13435 [Actinopolyspora mortivallis]
MTGSGSEHRCSEDFPRSREVLAELVPPLNGYHNDFARLVESGGAENEHYSRLIRYLDLSLDSQVAGYGIGVARFPHKPTADPFMEFAEIKLNARELIRRAASALGSRVEPEGSTLLPFDAYSMPWYLLWLGALGNRAQSGLGAYAGLLVWHHVCVSLVERIMSLEHPPPEDFVMIFRRFAELPERVLRVCLQAAEEGLRSGDDRKTALVAARLAETSVLRFMSAPTQ